MTGHLLAVLIFSPFGYRFLTRGTYAPKSDLSLIDNEAVVMHRRQARRESMAIRIHYRVTISANNMVVVVSNPCFIKRWLAFGLNLANNSALNQRIKVIINSLF